MANNNETTKDLLNEISSLIFEHKEQLPSGDFKAILDTLKKIHDRPDTKIKNNEREINYLKLLLRQEHEENDRAQESIRQLKKQVEELKLKDHVILNIDHDICDDNYGVPIVDNDKLFEAIADTISNYEFKDDNVVKFCVYYGDRWTDYRAFLTAQKNTDVIELIETEEIATYDD